MRISDWNSDVCSSDLRLQHARSDEAELHLHGVLFQGRCHRLIFLFHFGRDAGAGFLQRLLKVIRGDYLDGYIAAQRNETGAAHQILQIRSRSEEHTSELQSLMRNSYAVFCLKKQDYKSTSLATEIH